MLLTVMKLDDFDLWDESHLGLSYYLNQQKYIYYFNLPLWSSKD